MSDVIDLGHDHRLQFLRWAPDRDLNPQVSDVPDVERYAAVIEHLTPEGDRCAGGVTFDSPTARKIEPGKAMWSVESWAPLTLSPSVLCLRCGDHGFVRDGRWVVA
ncbi:hypothetical protein [Streptomyces sp. LUP30]|uniref:hypothetical protein n=1 Tax=Streptomyces sp. LUP30 TaxID=1890285 RepID=UPI0008518C96|nr:hypothetical protein [Streptomyces sp. LUP30]